MSGLNNWTWVVIGTVVLGAVGGAFAYKPYGWVGAVLYGVAGATVGLLATLLKQPVHSVGQEQGSRSAWPSEGASR